MAATMRALTKLKEAAVGKLEACPTSGPASGGPASSPGAGGPSPGPGCGIAVSGPPKGRKPALRGRVAARFAAVIGGLSACCLCAVIPLRASVPEPETGTTRDFRYLMGTSVEVRAHGGTESVRAEAIAEAFGAMVEVDRLMSNWRADSEITAANRNAADNEVRLSDPLFSVIQAGQLVADRSGGAFDLTVGPAVVLWGFRSRKPHEPTAAELAGLRGLVDYRNITLDVVRKTMHFARAGVEIDLGGIAKGFAVEVASGSLRRRGLTGFIDAGGNQYMLGVPPGKLSWTVGVRDPDREALLGELSLPEGSVSTSAQYANFLTINGRRVGHIIDPRTLAPTASALSVTLFSPDGTLADAVSKAAFVLGPVKGLALIDSFPNMLGVIAYRDPVGRVALAMNERAKKVYRPAGS
jgi:FAD:protein FMN transferase